MEVNQDHVSGLNNGKGNEPTPDKPVTDRPSIHILADFLAANPEVKYIRYQWVDFSGILRVRLVSKRYSLQLASTDSPIVIPQVALTILVDSALMPDTVPAGRDKVYPDWTSLRKTNFGSEGNRYASVMCWIFESDCEVPDRGYQRCPRAILRRVLRQARDCNLDFLVGFEVEFMLTGTSANGDRYPLDPADGQYTASSVRVPSFRYVEECIETLEALNVNVMQFHSEGNLSQFEISTGPLRAMEAVDALILTHEVIKNVAAKHGLQATMYPNPFAGRNDYAANGAHMHLSIHPADLEEPFLAGLLRRLPALCALTLPIPASYDRMRVYEIGEVVGWGTDNRALPIRKIKRGHWELRFLDGTANMYLALAACIAAGLQGVRKGEELVWKDCSSTWYRNLSDDERRANDKPLPKSLTEAIGHLKEDMSDLGELVGTPVLERYIQVKEHEVEKMKAMDSEERRRIYVQRFS